MPIPRFRIRTLMIAVAVVGVTLGAPSVRREWLLERARHHERQSRSVGISDLEIFLYGVCPSGPTNAEITALYAARSAELRPVMAFRDYHRERADAYERAATTWARVPDAATPPPPKPSDAYIESLKRRMVADWPSGTDRF